MFTCETHSFFAWYLLHFEPSVVNEAKKIGMIKGTKHWDTMSQSNTMCSVQWWTPIVFWENVFPTFSQGIKGPAMDVVDEQK
jgi:hypothetical protein